MAEELSKYLINLGVKARYIHSDVPTIERVEIISDLRAGVYDVLIGVNLLREGLDLPEVSLVAILDADKEGFLRSERSLTQTAGRAARNVNSKVIMYADKTTSSMRRTIDESNRRREKQVNYNQKYNITPTQIQKSEFAVLGNESTERTKSINPKAYIENNNNDIAADPVVKYMSKDQIKKAIQKIKKMIEKSVKELDFIEAARLRDEITELQKLVQEK